jgi:hypothetical protein
VAIQREDVGIALYTVTLGHRRARRRYGGEGAVETRWPGGGGSSVLQRESSAVLGFVCLGRVLPGNSMVGRDRLDVAPQRWPIYSYAERPGTTGNFVTGLLATAPSLVGLALSAPDAHGRSTAKVPSVPQSALPASRPPMPARSTTTEMTAPTDAAGDSTASSSYAVRSIAGSMSSGGPSAARSPSSSTPSALAKPPLPVIGSGEASHAARVTTVFSANGQVSTRRVLALFELLGPIAPRLVRRFRSRRYRGAAILVLPLLEHPG